MDKKQIISFIQNQIALQKISHEDLVAIAEGTPPTIGSTPVASDIPVSTAAIQEGTSKNVINTFYIIGAIIVLVGVIILIGQNWDEIGYLGRVLVTLGISLVTYMAGLVFSKSVHNALSQVLFLISAVLAPVGVIIMLDEMDIDITIMTQAIMALILAIMYGVAYLISRKNILIMAVVIFATWAYYAFLIEVFDELLFDNNLIQWATMFLGFWYIALAYGFTGILSANDPRPQEKKAVSHLLYAGGTLAILGAGISIGGIWDLIFILFIFGAFYASIFLRSRAMLIIAAGFLVGHVIKLTSKYFIDSIGWPLALIICGFIVIGVGYMTYYFNKKYISQK
ncbi:MAG: DUF2157 domain-containing protein [bacterium]|nr:DUF2157 domain-containing protein [bacterium]